MAILKLFTELANKSAPVDADILAIEEGSSGNYYNITIADLLKNINLIAFTESTYDNGNLASGTLTPDCDTDGNSHKVTMTGAATIEVPTKTLTGDQSIEAAINILGGDTYTVTWGFNWDWGDAGAPTLTANSMIGFYRRAGDTKTKAWHHGGYA